MADFWEQLRGNLSGTTPPDTTELGHRLDHLLAEANQEKARLLARVRQSAGKPGDEQYWQNQMGKLETVRQELVEKRDYLRRNRLGIEGERFFQDLRNQFLAPFEDRTGGQMADLAGTHDEMLNRLNQSTDWKEARADLAHDTQAPGGAEDTGSGTGQLNEKQRAEDLVNLMKLEMGLESESSGPAAGKDTGEPKKDPGERSDPPAENS